MKLKKAPPPVSDINVTPMVDVMLVVLIIFMVITPMLNKGANIELPKARNPIPLADAPGATGRTVWTQVNLVNLRENIAPTRGRAHLVLEKGCDHAIGRVRLRKL